MKNIELFTDEMAKSVFVFQPEVREREYWGNPEGKKKYRKPSNKAGSVKNSIKRDWFGR